MLVLDQSDFRLTKCNYYNDHFFSQSQLFPEMIEFAFSLHSALPNKAEITCLHITSLKNVTYVMTFRYRMYEHNGRNRKANKKMFCLVEAEHHLYPTAGLQP